MRGNVHLESQRDYFDSRTGSDHSDVIGCFYLDVDGSWLEILDAVMIKIGDHIADGLALLLGDGYWRFGCSEKYIGDEGGDLDA